MILDLNDRTIQLARETREILAKPSLIPAVAKLYSQHTRLISGRPGLHSWGESEAVLRLDDANRLIQCAYIEREAGESHWSESMRRAGELLEWLSHPEFELERIPILLLSAAAYQLAGYPARSLGLLKNNTHYNPESNMLAALLSVDFLKLSKLIAKFWKSEGMHQSRNMVKKEGEFSEEVSRWVIKETVRVLGILCAYMRWGEDERLHVALSKMEAISRIYLHGQDSYSWLLTKLCSDIARLYYDTSLRKSIKLLKDSKSSHGQKAFERYMRFNYTSGKSLVWLSQINGIKQLISKDSFALCTPTGSGKTAIAEMAIIQSLFPDSDYERDLLDIAQENIILYLVPSRALATEVEAKLSKVMKQLSTNSHVTVTGLYGGTDWGPTDAWITADENTVLVCTYEKAEALIRFMGPFFLHRVSLVVLDEAHSIMFDGRDLALKDFNSRSLKLESLCSRLFSHITEDSRIIALSAVAKGIEDSIASWVMGEPGNQAISTDYKSTRQLVGQLECLPNRGFRIIYDVMDGANLEFKDGDSNDKPFIPNPFPPHPPASLWEQAGPEKKLRPYLFWAALQLASPDDKGEQHTVLISITQNIERYAKDFLDLLELWSGEGIPRFFVEPKDEYKIELWHKCLKSCRDYFGEDSNEYKLLIHGVVLHHGKMPGMMSRLTVELIQQQVIYVVVATSTLSEGVNLPFETVLIPSLVRWDVEKGCQVGLTPQEFKNLIGRAGRPGAGTEGRSLVLLSHRSDWSNKMAKKKYSSLIKNMQLEKTKLEKESNHHSSMARLINIIAEKWEKLTGSQSSVEFMEWLEKTAPVDYESESHDQNTVELIQYLDSLDFHLLSSIQEIEQLSDEEVSDDVLETKLINIWQSSFARYVEIREEDLSRYFVQRGLSLRATIYPDYSIRNKLYRSGLPPKEGKQLIELYPKLKDHLVTGVDYSSWDTDARIDFISQVIEIISEISRFSLDKEPGSGKNKPSWQTILGWWLASTKCIKWPPANKIASWYSYVNRNFIYKISWGLGNTIALAVYESEGEITNGLNIQEWPKLGLPWIVFWLKELIHWGTLNPVATVLLSHGLAVTRDEADKLSKIYYEEAAPSHYGDEIYNASNIMDWLISKYDNVLQKDKIPFKLRDISLKRDFSCSDKTIWRVWPVLFDERLNWFDSAGYLLATSEIILGWDENYINKYDFLLDTGKKEIRISHYI